MEFYTVIIKACQLTRGDVIQHNGIFCIVLDDVRSNYFYTEYELGEYTQDIFNEDTITKYNVTFDQNEQVNFCQWVNI